MDNATDVSNLGGNIDNQSLDLAPSKKRVWRSLSAGQKASLFSLVVVLVALPLGIIASIAPKLPLFSRASYPVTPPGPTPPSSGFNQAAKFNGGQARIKVSDPDWQLPDLSNAFTIEAWVAVETCHVHGEKKGVFGRTPGFPGGSDSSFQLYFLEDPEIGFGACNYLTFEFGEPPYDIRSYYGAWAPRTFRHVLVSGHGIDYGTWNLYVDGVLQAQLLGEYPNPNSGDTFYIGGILFPGEDPGEFKGEIDELRISTGIRYGGNFIPPSAPFTPDAQTVALYHFDEDATDASGNGYNGQIEGDVEFVTSIVPVPPVITTNNLPDATVGDPYEADVRGYDVNTGDTLTMYVQYLPPGLTMEECDTSTFEGVETIKCKIRGTPLERGRYGVLFTLAASGAQGGHDVQKSLRLDVHSVGESPTPSPTP